MWHELVSNSKSPPLRNIPTAEDTRIPSDAVRAVKTQLVNKGCWAAWAILHIYIYEHIHIHVSRVLRGILRDGRIWHSEEAWASRCSRDPTGPK